MSVQDNISHGREPFLEKDNENAIHLKIDDLATRYKDYLKTQNQDDDINKFLTEKLPAENK